MADREALELERRWRADPSDARTLEALLRRCERAQQDPPWDALAASPRWCRIAGFARKWLDSDLHPAYSALPDQIQRAERRLRITFPRVLREWYLLLGNREDLLVGKLMPPRLNQLRKTAGAEEKILVLSRLGDRPAHVYRNGERFPFWGVRVGDLDQLDPPVVKLVDDGDYLDDDLAGFPLSELFLSALLSELTTSLNERVLGPLLRGAVRGGWAEVPSDAPVTTWLEAHYARLPIPTLTAELFGDADTVLALEAGNQGTLPPGRRLFVIARSPLAWELVLERLDSLEFSLRISNHLNDDLDVLIPGLTHYVATRAPKTVAPPAEEAAVANLEAELGVALDPQHRRWLLEGGVRLTLGHGHRVLGVDEILEVWRELQEHDSPDRRLPEAMPGWHKPRLADRHVDPGWIPFAQSEEHGLICVDLAPGPEGASGQLVGWKDEPFLAGSLDVADCLKDQLEHYLREKMELRPDGAPTEPMPLDWLRRQA